MGFPSALYLKKKLGTFDCDNVVFYGIYFHCRRFSMLMCFFVWTYAFLCKGDLSYQMLFLFHLKRSVWIKHIHFYYKQIWITIFNSKSYISQKLASFYVQLMKNNAYILLDIYNYNCMFKPLIKKTSRYEKKSFMPSNILKIDKMMDLFSLSDDKK